MVRVSSALFLIASVAFGQYSSKPAGSPPPDLAPAIAAELAPSGLQVLSEDGKVYCEIWLRAKPPQGPETAENNVQLKTIPHGALVGVIRYAQEGKDRRGQRLKPGLYTLRFSYYPEDGAHLGVEPNRDFLVLSPAGEDTDPKATPGFNDLMAMSRKASGTNHPAVLSIWKVESGFTEGFAQTGEDWVWSTKLGDQPVSMILVGVNPH
jgi:hypothetical protein